MNAARAERLALAQYRRRVDLANPPGFAVSFARREAADWRPRASTKVDTLGVLTGCVMVGHDQVVPDAAAEVAWRRRFIKGVPKAIIKAANRVLTQINSARTLSDLRAPPGNHLEELAGD